MSDLPSRIKAWAALERGGQLKEIELPLPELGPHDVVLKVLACGVCHSDIHLIQDDWGISSYPLVPGHEIFGAVVARGRDAVLREGQQVGVGWQRSACYQCDDCLSGNDNLCEVNRLTTCVGHPGGYADYHVTDSRFAFELPPDLRAPEYAPLMCGGATVFTPLCEFIHSSEKAPRVGIVGAGGLGHLAIKLAVSMGCEVTVFTSSRSKSDECRAMGARKIVSSTDSAEIEAIGRRLDLVLVTANVDLPWSSYLSTLRSDGTLCFVGIPPSVLTFDLSGLLSKRLRIAASPISSRFKMRQMLEFCARHRIVPQAEVAPLSAVNEVIPRVSANRVRYRAVLVP